MSLCLMMSNLINKLSVYLYFIYKLKRYLSFITPIRFSDFSLQLLYAVLCIFISLNRMKNKEETFETALTSIPEMYYN